MKERDPASDAASARLKAGAEAELQMQHYLNRRFGQSEPNVFVLNDLRLEDSLQNEADGRVAVAQIDHLVLHPRGAFIIESKSVSTSVNMDWTEQGGEQWSRVVRGRSKGIPSPIAQAKRQAEFLRKFLQARRQSLLGEVGAMLKPIAKLFTGTTQRGFSHMPIQIVVAISDNSLFNHTPRSWRPQAGPFNASVRKADQISDFIVSEIEAHTRPVRPEPGKSREYGVWRMEEQEAQRVAEFLSESHTPRHATAPDPEVAPPKPRADQPAKPSTGSVAESKPNRAACKHCNSPDLSARHGRYGYYWCCNACSKNTAMPLVCQACGAGGAKGQGVRIRKDGPAYFRDCEHCGINQKIWTEPVATGS